MRIVSLLPSATESLFALGLGSSLVAVTHECDFPPEASSLPIVTRSTLRLHDRDSAGIETAVSEAAVAGRSLYFVDTQAIQELEPDLVVAQDVCRVCAVSADQVAVDLEGIRMIRPGEGVRCRRRTVDEPPHQSHRSCTANCPRTPASARSVPRMAGPAISRRALDT